MRQIFALLFSVVFALTLSAQTTTSSINGRVVDNNGEILVGATIVAVHIPSGTQYATIATLMVITTCRVCVRVALIR